MRRTKILFLCTRLTGYWYDCIKKLSAVHESEILIIRQQANKDAPFNFQQQANITIQDFSGTDLVKTCTQYEADLMYVAGWKNKIYNKIARYYKNKAVPVVCGMDNHWLGTLKQLLATYFSKYILHNKFTHIWIPGFYQYEFAHRLGFKNFQVITCLYAADLDKFLITKPNVNKRFVFVGRLAYHKGVDILIQAYKKLKDEFTDTWDIVFIGNGEYEIDILNNKLNHIKFLQPELLQDELRKGGVLVLPSRYEAWGVVVQEASASGMPVISSYQCGAARQFIIPGYNGYLSKGGDVDSLFQCMKKIINKSDKELAQMGERSIELSKSITQEMWAYQIMSVVNL